MFNDLFDSMCRRAQLLTKLWKYNRKLVGCVVLIYPWCAALVFLCLKPPQLFGILFHVVPNPVGLWITPPGSFYSYGFAWINRQYQLIHWPSWSVTFCNKQNCHFEVYTIFRQTHVVFVFLWSIMINMINEHVYVLSEMDLPTQTIQYPI